MKWKKQYTKEFSYPQTNTNSRRQDATTKKGDKKNKFSFQRQVRCFVCDSPDHLARDCKASKSESHGRKNWVVRTEDKPIEISTNNFSKLVDSFFPPIEASVSTVQGKEVTQIKSIEVQIEVLPIRGITDTGSDITILSGTAFQEIVTACGIKREQFKPPDRAACTYGRQPLKLDEQLDLQIKFGEKSKVSV